LAMLTLLARLGLRAGEVAGLMLDDIDWRAREIIVRGKGRRSERLPLPADVGEPIAAYLRNGRPAPAGAQRQVFLRVKALRSQAGPVALSIRRAWYSFSQPSGAAGVSQFAHRPS